MKKVLLVVLTILVISNGFSQKVNKEDSTMIRQIFTTSLTDGASYDWLDYMSNEIGSRLSGSLGAELAVNYTKEQMEELGLDKVWLQPVMVPKWTRGTKEFSYIETSPGVTTTADVCALGGSVPTPYGGLKAKVIEVKNFKELEALGRENVEGKIVFYNRPMDATLIQTGGAYGGAVNQRTAGAKEAAKYGAVGVIVRSMNLLKDDYPHTGTMSYGDTPAHLKIPACAISTNGANYLSTTLKLQPNLLFYLSMSCKTHADVQSYNVIGEIKGSMYPNKYIVVGGHLDSWDLGDGSQDDGAGCVQSMEVLRILKKLDYKPKYTIRIVLFMNEENGLRGGKKYAAEAKRKGEHHIFALESDAGGFTPRGFSFTTDDKNFVQIKSWESLFEPYLINWFTKGGGGADIGPLKKEGVVTVLAGLRPDSQRYFDFHHAANDIFKYVNKRELELGAAAMTSLIYLFDKYGVK